MIFLIIGFVLSQDGECPEGQILQADGSCLLCQEGYGILPSRICGICPSFEGINTVTGKCGPCAENECIDIDSKKCVLAGPKNAIIDPISKKCSCENFKGFDSNGKCSECSIDQCFDPDSNKCIDRPSYRGIESTTGKCIKCPKGQGIDRITYQCTILPIGGYVDDSGYNSCPEPFGIDQKTNECIYCKKGEHVHPTTQRCQVCPPKYSFVNEDNNQCNDCPTGKGYDTEEADCAYPDSGYGVDPNTNLIIKCPEGSSKYSSKNYCKCSNSNYGINSEGKCGECGAGYIINLQTFLCEKCPEKQANINGKCQSCPANKIFNDATKQCDECPENQCLDIVNQKCIAIPTNGYKDENKCYCEKDNEHFNPETQQCGSCSNGKGSLDGTCTECPEDRCIDPSNQICVQIPNGQYRIKSTGLCSSCPDGEAISPYLDGCIICSYDECIDSNKKCRHLKENEIADPVTKECKCKDTYGVYKSKCTVCPDGYGINKNNNCISCNSQCVDPDTKICRPFNNDEGFNKKTRQCLKCQAGASVDPSTHQCICPEGRGFNSSTGRCYRCAEGEGVSPSTKECITCQIGEGILETGYCGTCPNGQGIDSITKKCTICPSDQGILPTTNICGNCPEGSTLNAENKKCECNEGYRVTDLGGCFKCSENSEVSDDGKKCICDVGYIIDADGSCAKCAVGLTSSYGYCTSCSRFECIDENSKLCTSMQSNMGKHPVTNMCITCPDGSSRSYAGYCICPENKGLSEDIKCVTCNPGEGIDDRGLCKQCNPDQCISKEDHKCTRTGTQYVKDENGNCLTECPDGQYYHPSTRICGNCPEGSTGSTDTGQCNCNENEGVIDVENNFKCGTCPETYGIGYTKKCTQCPKYQCINENGQCIDIPYSSYKNLNDGKCVSNKCPEGYISFSQNFNSYCIKCPNDQCFDSNELICREPSNNEEINAENHLCQCKNKGYGYNLDDDFLNCIECPSTYCINKNGYCTMPGKTNSIDPITQKCLDDCPNGFNPITKICDNCPEGSSPDTSSKGRCKCTNAQEGFIEGENKCGPCPYGYCINDKGICIDTSDSYAIDPISYTCLELPYQCRDNFKGINPFSKLCYYCNDDECIDPDTRECIPIPKNNGKSIEDGTCMECVYPYLIDQKTNNCICNSGQGYDDKYDHCEICEYGIDPSTNKCTNCYSNKEGIDHDTKLCRKCNQDEGIDINTHECITCTNGTIKDLDTLFCICPNKQGINIDTMQCGPCKANEGIDPKTLKCGKCPYGLGIDPDSSFCITCPEKQGIDKNTGICITCPEKQGIDPFSNICQECDNDKGINRKTGICEKCASYQFIDENKKCTCENNKVLNLYGECTKCNTNYGPNSDYSECIECYNANLGYDGDNGICIKCSLGQGVSQSSRKCESASESSCINPNNGHLIDVYSNSQYQVNSDTSMCECKSTGYGIALIEDSDDIICIKCNINQGIDPATYRCTECDNENGDGIDSTNRKCRKCDSKTEAINPITFECSTSPNGAQKVGNFWECPNSQNFDSTGSNCVSCKDKSQYIDSFSGKCVECKGNYEMVDESTQKCTCTKKHGYSYSFDEVVCSSCSFGIDPNTNLCVKCDNSKNEGIDEDTGLCRPIKDGEGIEISTSIIKKCPKGAKVDPFTLECKCDDGYVVDSDECRICSFPEYIDSSGNCVLCNEYINDGICRSYCGNNQCADKDTKICRDISFGEEKELSSYICTCSIGFVFDTNSKKCFKCKGDEEISEDGTCKKCNEGYAVNPSTYKCEKCENGNGIDSISLRCGKCKEGEGINPKTRMCGVCRDNEGINALTGECGNCFSDQFIDSKTKICTCPNMQGADYENKKCISCTTGQGIDPITRKCIECPDGQGINPITGECVSCSGGQIKQETTNFCTCQNGQGFNSEESKCEECTVDKILNQKTNICERCPDFEGINSEGTGCVKCNNENNEAIDPKTYKCRKCNEDEGIDSITGQCLECPSGAVVNPTSHFCECQALKGIDIDSWMCISCYNFEGIDPVTKKCTRCNVGEGIVTTTFACGKCGNGQGIDGVSGKCRECAADEGIDQETQICGQCSFGEGIISGTHECGKCPPGQGINKHTKICGECNSGEGINPVSRKCEQCSIGEGIDSSSKECKQCPSGQGINSETKTCQECKSNEQIDPTTKYCVKCIGGFGYDANEEICKKCSDEQCTQCTENFNICTKCNQGYDIGTEGTNIGKCILSSSNPKPPVQIEAVKPNKIEQVTAELETDSETSNIILKKSDSIQGKACTASIDYNLNEKTIVVNDIGQTQTELSLNDVIKITIIQNSNKPIYIKNNKDNINEEIEVTIQNLNFISLKGKGKINVINKGNENPINLDYISPDFDKQLTIKSNSKISVKKLDIYGDSNVEFENEALVSTIVVQQKAQTTLKNVEINNEMIIGLQSSVNIDENVKISNAAIQLTYSNIPQDLALISGKLNTKPRSIVIKDQNIGVVLDEDSEFVIAKSSDSGFKCNDWAGAFDAKTNSKYNRAVCNPPDESGSVLLFADNKGTKGNGGKGGLSPGIIALIVIIVVVVVATVIILVWFFVIRKKKNSDSLNEDSLSGENNADEI